MATTKEEATSRARLYPSTYRHLRIRSASQGKTIAEVAEDMRKKSALYEKSQKQ